jgi:hypothetical protein
VIAENGLWFCDKCKSLLVEHESWFVEIASEHLCVCCAENEIVGLRDQLRWRKWPEEKPEYQGQYQAFWDRSEGVFVVNYDPFAQAKWKHCIAPPILWRPIGPLPGGE